MRNEKWEICYNTGNLYIFHSTTKKPLPFTGNGLNYFPFGKASSESSLKKSYSKMTLILISSRTSKLLRLKMLYTFVRSQGICIANHAADLPCFLRISSMCLPIFILQSYLVSLLLVLLACKGMKYISIYQHIVVEFFFAKVLKLQTFTDIGNRLLKI